MSERDELRSILADQVERLFADQVAKETLERAEAGGWDTALWQAVEENGLPRVLVPEDQGGVGGGWSEAAVVLRAAGRHQAPLPVAESVLAGWLLSGAGLEMPDGAVTVGPVRRDERLELSRDGDGWRLDGTLSRVPWGRNAGHIAVLAMADASPYAALVAAGGWQVSEDSNIAAEPRDGCRFDGAPVLAAAPAATDSAGFYQAGALARAAQIAGALEFVLAQSVQYANDRAQFGRPIGKFQAVQQELARLAGEVAASIAAVDMACRAAERGDGGFEIAAAKLRTSEAASAAAAIGHQAHGAIGFTYEHALHFATRRLWSWRAEFGSETAWAERLGRDLAGRGAEALWPYLTDRTATG